ncbi:MAG: succinyl-CoA--3-ketoacid-CoA transferase [Clostridia bacterium]|nr:succinyl-CoA--3-ketoacid-CoA transferase [Clostridia bacterium]
MDVRKTIAKNIAKMLKDGDFVNLGIGIPTLVGNYIPEGMEVEFHGENGFVGQNRELDCKDVQTDPVFFRQWLDTHGGEQTDCYGEEGHRDLINAGGFYINLLPGSACFDTSISFIMARGGHLDATVLGGLQVDRHGNLANWKVPGKKINGMGGAMDLACGAKKVIVAMEHCTKDGQFKILDDCTMPLTAVGCVDALVTELCVIEFRGNGPVVTAMAPGMTPEELQAKTGTKLEFAETIEIMDIVD